MGAIKNAIWFVHTEASSGKPLGQGQEAGRDQGHSLLDFAELGVLAQQAYNQGEDLFALNNNLILAGYVFNPVRQVSQKTDLGKVPNTCSSTILATMFRSRHTSTRIKAQLLRLAPVDAAASDQLRS